MLAGEQKKASIELLAKHKGDTGSSVVQASILTKRIEEITAHLKSNKHDFMARRGLLQLVGQRRRLLKYVAKTNPSDYLKTVKKLGLRH
ncbi:MAG TPA: 30S ribosomal protein S15 [Candidatus Saccharimonadales bacterium]|nr:30S ribosomal protein S15 [Candidatus Saccharimonadales bacterium]